MFSWAGELASITWHIVLMYFTICFKKVDYVVVKKSLGDEGGLMENDVEANLAAGSVVKETCSETDRLVGKKVEKKIEKKIEKTSEEVSESSDQYRQIIGRTKEGIPIRIM